ncbi:MAG: TRAP transporter small permease subunit [Thalassovita sp.]
MRVFKRVLALFHALTNAMNAVGTIGIFALMVLIVTDVTMRSLVNQPLVGVPELVKVGIVSIVFLQAAHTLAAGRFTSSTMFLAVLDRRVPVLGAALRAVFYGAGGVLFYFVARGAFNQVIYNYETQEFIGSQGIFTVPVWPMHAVIVFGSAVLALQFCLTGLGFLAELPIRKNETIAEEIEV